MRRVICSCLGAMLIYFGVMTMPSFAGQSVDIADMENTGDVTVRYWGGGSRRTISNPLACGVGSGNSTQVVLPPCCHRAPGQVIVK